MTSQVNLLRGSLVRILPNFYPLIDAELVVQDEEGVLGQRGVALVEEGDVAAFPLHLVEVYQGRVQTNGGA